VDRRYELENLRRALAMLPPQAPAGLKREQAIDLVDELQDAIGRLTRLRQGLVALLEDGRAGPWWSSPERGS
jgi:hypothetical protein